MNEKMANRLFIYGVSTKYNLQSIKLVLNKLN